MKALSPSALERSVPLLVALLAVVNALVGLVSRWQSARIGEGLIYSMRTQIFDHMLRMPIAFFSRSHTGKLVSRLQSDVNGAQQAFTSTLYALVSNGVTLVLVLGSMLVLSWPLTLGAIVLLPIFMIPASSCKFAGSSSTIRISALFPAALKFGLSMCFPPPSIIKSGIC